MTCALGGLVGDLGAAGSQGLDTTERGGDLSVDLSDLHALFVL